MVIPDYDAQNAFMEEGPIEDTQESEFDTAANAMTEWTPDDLYRMAYRALDLLHNTIGITSEMDRCIGNAKLCIEAVRDELYLWEQS